MMFILGPIYGCPGLVQAVGSNDWSCATTLNTNDLGQYS
jgi:hypothetical protein